MTNLEKDAETLRNAMIIGKDEALIDVISHRTYQQLSKISETFSKTYKKELISEFQKYFSGKTNLEELSVALVTNPIEFDCHSIHKALKGISCDLETIVEIVSTRPSFMLKQMNSKYLELFKNNKGKGKELKKEFESSTSGIVKKILTSLIDKERSVNNSPNIDECQNKAEKLKHEGVKRWTGDDSFFIKIFTTSSPMEIAYISRLYHKMMGFSILQGINHELNGDAKKFLTNFVFAVLSPSEFFATKLNKAITNKNDKIITRIIVRRHEIDMEQIKQYYLQLYGKELSEELKNHFSGIYYQILNNLI